MFEQITDFWEKKGFEVVFWGSIAIIVLCIFLSIGKRSGTYDRNMWDYPKIFDRYIIPDKPKRKQRDSTGEITCRRYLETRFNLPFTKARPDFLRNQVTSGSRGDYNLELDCFNPEMKLAVEYNGVQHYKFVPYFHRTKETFYNQKYRDEIKKYKCKENGIDLIEVPYDVKNIENFIEDELQKLGY